MADLFIGSTEFTGSPGALSDYPTPLGDYLSAQFRSGFQSALDWADAVQKGDWIPGNNSLGKTVIGTTPEGLAIYGTDPSQTRVDAASAQSALDAAGVKLTAPPDGMYQDTINDLVQHKQEQVARQSAIAASPTGVRSVAGFTANVAGSMLDPLNLAASFVPLAGPLKYSAMVADAGSALGRAGVRIGVGAAEGAVGAALIQPVTAFAAASHGDDYTMTQALENIGFGAAFGATLHTAGGLVSDVMHGAPVRAPETGPDLPTIPTSPEMSAAERARNYTPEQLRFMLPELSGVGQEPVSPLGSAWMNNAVSHETRMTATRTAIGQMLDGRGVEIDPIFRGDQRLQFELAQRFNPQDMNLAIAQARDDVLPQLHADLSAQAANAAPTGAITEMQAQLGHIEAELAIGARVPDADIKALQANQRLKFQTARDRAQAAWDARRADLSAQAERLNQQIDTNTQAARAAQDLAQVQRGVVPDQYADRVQARAEQLMRGDPLTAAIRQSFSPSPAKDVAAAQRYNSPESVSVADPVASAAATAETRATSAGVRDATPEGAEELMATAQQRLDDILADMERRGASADALQSIRRDLEPFESQIADSDNLAGVLRAAALCGLRNG